MNKKIFLWVSLVGLVTIIVSLIAGNVACWAWATIWPLFLLLLLLGFFLDKYVHVTMTYWIIVGLRVIFCLVSGLVCEQVVIKSLGENKQYWLWWMGHYLISLATETYLQVKVADYYSELKKKGIEVK